MPSAIAVQTLPRSSHDWSRLFVKGPRQSSISTSYFQGLRREAKQRGKPRFGLPDWRLGKVAPEVGFEPTTNRLTADRSTTELLRSVVGQDTNRDLGRFKRKL